MHVNKLPSECSGCTACASICPRGCISMDPDALGFVYPSVDESVCIDCGLCAKVCPFDKANLESLFSDTYMPSSYAVKSLRDEDLALSQSGGAFALLSDWVLDQGGAVYGAVQDEEFMVVHRRASTPLERDAMRGSKYVQSRLDGVFGQVRGDLNAGLRVLFSGTPCQVAGLKAFLESRPPLGEFEATSTWRERLLLVDIICHGVPSPSVWKSYLNYIVRCHGSRIVKADFRDKSYGWHSHFESFLLEDGRKIKSREYTHIFYTHADLRHSCHNCPFTSLRRVSDLTIGDCWGIEKTALASMGEDKKGCSLVMVNSNGGRELLRNISSSGDVLIEEIPISEVMQPQLEHPAELSPLREQFEKDFQSLDFKKLVHRYGRLHGWKRIRSIVRPPLVRLKRKLKSLLLRKTKK